MKEIKIQPHYLKVVEPYGLSAEKLKCYEFEKDETLFVQGSSRIGLFFLIEGKVTVTYYLEDGTVSSLNYCPSDGVLGDVELMLENGSSTTYVTASSKLICLYMPLAEAKKEKLTNITFSNKLGADLAAKLIRSTDDHAKASAKSGKVKLAEYLLLHSVDNYVSEKMTKIAETTGISYRQTLRISEEWIHHGVIKKVHGGYAICNLNKLKEISYER